MDKELTELVFILDRSGSMQERVGDVLGGFNGLLEKQRVEPGRAHVTLAIFDTEHDVIHNGCDILSVPALTSDVYFARGGTALNDAIARTIDLVGRRLAARPEHKRPAKVVVTVMTDGHENASSEYGGPEGLRRLKAKIEEQKTKYNWDFTFIGANIDAIAVASSYAIAPHKAINYMSSAGGVGNIMRSVDAYVSNVRNAKDAVEVNNVSYSSQDRVDSMVK